MRIRKYFAGVTPKRCAVSVLGGAILGFGLMEVHSVADITEGGALGLTLLLNHFLKLSPAYSGLVINAVCYAMGIKLFGGAFIACSALSAGAFSITYRLCEGFPPLFPYLARMPLLSAFAGAAFVGVGVGICVRAGGAPTGDDALAMSLSKLTKLGIEWMYLASDLTVLALSLTYIPLKNVLCSLVTVVLSGQLIGWIQRIQARRKA